MKHFYFILLFPFALQAQTTRELFSRPGLTINAYHHNFFDGTYNLSLRYVRDTIVCSDTLLLFQHTGGPNSYELIDINEGKVYNVFGPNCNKYLYYDFDLEVGDIFEGAAIGVPLQVIEKGIYTLLNNEQRRYLKLTNPSAPSFILEWVEGIGDIRRALLPIYFDFEGYSQFVCARDSNAELFSTPVSTEDLCDSLSCQIPYSRFLFAKSDKVVTFTNTSLNATNYLWDFGDGTTSTETNPVHEYADPGCYAVTLRAFTGCLTQPNVYTYAVGVCLDGGWEPRPMPAPVTATEITFLNDSTGYLIAQNRLFYTTDGAYTWEQKTLPPLPSTGAEYFVDKISMINQDSGIVKGSWSSPPQVLLTSDGGATWIPSSIESNSSLTDAIMLPGGHIAAIELYQSIYFSNDYGQQWIKVDYPDFGIPALTHAVNVIKAGNDFCVL
jgi:PKD domain/Photosynthesis system II assembly factor YCF48